MKNITTLQTKLAVLASLPYSDVSYMEDDEEEIEELRKGILNTEEECAARLIEDNFKIVEDDNKITLFFNNDRKNDYDIEEYASPSIIAIMGSCANVEMGEVAVNPEKPFTDIIDRHWERLFYTPMALILYREDEVWRTASMILQQEPFSAKGVEAALAIAEENDDIKAALKKLRKQVLMLQFHTHVPNACMWRTYEIFPIIQRLTATLLEAKNEEARKVVLRELDHNFSNAHMTLLNTDLEQHKKHMACDEITKDLSWHQL